MKKNKFPAEAMADIMNRMQSFGELKTVFNTAEKAIYIYDNCYSIPGYPPAEYSFNEMEEKPIIAVKSAKEFNIFLDTYDKMSIKMNAALNQAESSTSSRITKLKEELETEKDSREYYRKDCLKQSAEKRELKEEFEKEKEKLLRRDKAQVQTIRELREKEQSVRVLKGQLTKAKNKAAKLQDEVNRFRKGLTN